MDIMGKIQMRLQNNTAEIAVRIWKENKSKEVGDGREEVGDGCEEVEDGCKEVGDGRE